MHDRYKSGFLPAFLGLSLSGAVSIIGMLLASPAALAGAAVYATAAQCMGYGCTVLMAFLVAGRKPMRLGFTRPMRGDIARGAASALLLYPAMTLVAAVSAYLFPHSVLDTSGEAGAIMDAMGPGLRMLALAVAPAIGEEILCRGLLFGAVRRGGRWCGIFVPAFCFSLLHGNIQQCAYAFLFGAVLGILREASGSVWPCVAAHMVFNAVSAVTGGIAVRVPMALWFLCTLAMTNAAGVLLFRMLRRQDAGEGRIRDALPGILGCALGFSVNTALLALL